MTYDGYQQLGIAVLVQAIQVRDTLFYKSDEFEFWCAVAEVNAAALRDKLFVKEQDNDPRAQPVLCEGSVFTVQADDRQKGIGNLT